MAIANSTGVRSRADHLARIAPSYPQSPADKAAHAAVSYVRPVVAQAGDSDPIMDEAYRRVRDHRDAILEGLAAARAYADSAAA
jgi:hypothetical protein